jgi:hypothetical protein
VGTPGVCYSLEKTGEITPSTEIILVYPLNGNAAYWFTFE